MAAPKYLRKGTAGNVAVTTAVVVATADSIPATGPDGKLDISFIPNVDVNTVLAFENLAIGDLVNFFLSGGVTKARKADATTPGKEADGYVLAAVTAGNPATVYSEGTNSGVSGLTVGSPVFMSATAGLSTTTEPTAAGQVSQRIGVAITATSYNFDRGLPFEL